MSDKNELFSAEEFPKEEKKVMTIKTVKKEAVTKVKVTDRLKKYKQVNFLNEANFSLTNYQSLALGKIIRSLQKELESREVIETSIFATKVVTMDVMDFPITINKARFIQQLKQLNDEKFWIDWEYFNEKTKTKNKVTSPLLQGLEILEGTSLVKVHLSNLAYGFLTNTRMGWALLDTMASQLLKSDDVRQFYGLLMQYAGNGIYRVSLDEFRRKMNITSEKVVTWDQVKRVKIRYWEKEIHAKTDLKIEHKAYQSKEKRQAEMDLAQKKREALILLQEEENERAKKEKREPLKIKRRVLPSQAPDMIEFKIDSPYKRVLGLLKEEKKGEMWAYVYWPFQKVFGNTSSRAQEEADKMYESEKGIDFYKRFRKLKEQESFESDLHRLNTIKKILVENWGFKQEDFK